MKNLLARIKWYLKQFTSSQESLVKELSPEEYKLIYRIKLKRLTYLSDERLLSIFKTCRLIEESKLSGVFLEAGCALGGSAILIASLKNSKRPLFIYDVFGMIPPPTKEDTQDVHDRYKTIVEGESRGIGGDKYYGYQANLFEIVKSNLNFFGINTLEQSVTLVKGLVQDTMKIEQPVAFAHIDVDWYEPVKTCLERVFPLLVIGGSIILDVYHVWGGCRKATDEYLQKITGQFVLNDSAGSMKITRVVAQLSKAELEPE
jgi:hypothetical protein